MNCNSVQPPWYEWVKMTTSVGSSWKISGSGHWCIFLTPTLAKVRVGVRVGSKAMRRTMKKFSPVACSGLCSNWALTSQRSRPQNRSLEILSMLMLLKTSQLWLCSSWLPSPQSCYTYEWLSPVFILSLHSESRSLSIKIIGKELYINLCLDSNLILLN